MTLRHPGQRATDPERVLTAEPCPEPTAAKARSVREPSQDPRTLSTNAEGDR